jgi:hypothetical protein
MSYDLQITVECRLRSNEILFVFLKDFIGSIVRMWSFWLDNENESCSTDRKYILCQKHNVDKKIL